MSLIIDDLCFACGKRNQNGLKLDIRPMEVETPDGVRVKASASFTADARFQGYGGIVHGGILSTVLDELMIYALYFEKIPTVTAKMEVTFKRKASAGETLAGEARMTRSRGSMVEAEAVLLNGDGEVVASARGLFARVENVVRT